MIKKKALIVFCLLGFIALFFSYKNFSSKIPISYFDEEWWVGDSYFFQFYIYGKYSKDIWNNVESSDQPNLTRFIFGAWLYPGYLNEKKQDSNLDYTKYLINHGFYFVKGIDRYTKYKESLGPNFVTLNVGEAGSSGSLIKKYGRNIVKNIDLIMRVRLLNVAILSMTAMLLFIYFKNIKGLIFGLLFALFFASNNLIITTSLLAHSEALFILFFSLSLIYMFKFLSNNSKWINLVLFSIFLGLCFSTKLNGIILYLPYLIIVLIGTRVNIKKNKSTNILLQILCPLTISFIIFVVLNPYVFTSPVLNIIRMLAQRESTVQYQILLFPSASLPSLVSRVNFIAQSLFNVSQTSILNILLIVSFVVGFYVEILNVRKEAVISRNIMVVFCSILIVTVFYLQLAWPRYVIHLVLFYIYYIVIGLSFCLSKVKYLNIK